MDTVKRNPRIDFVKGISILVIMLCHTMQVNTDLNVYNVSQKLDTELQNYRDGDIIKITNISSGGNRK